MFEKIENPPGSSAERQIFFIGDRPIIMVGHSSQCPARKPGKMITVVLDMDQTSLDAVFPRGFRTTSHDLITLEQRKWVAGMATVYLRPGVQDFLMGLRESSEIEVIIWTAALDTMAQSYLYELHQGESEPSCDYVIYRDRNEWEKDAVVSFEKEEYREEAFKNLARLCGANSNRTQDTVFIIDDNRICCDQYNRNRSIQAPKFFHDKEENLFFFGLLGVFADAYNEFDIEAGDLGCLIDKILELYRLRYEGTRPSPQLPSAALSEAEDIRSRFFNTPTEISEQSSTESLLTEESFYGQLRR